MKLNSKITLFVAIIVFSSIAIYAQLSDTKISQAPSKPQQKNIVANIGRKLYFFELEDQFKTIHRWFHYGNKPQIYVISDRVGFEFIENWTAPLKEHFETKGVLIHTIVSLPEIKPFAKGFFRNQIKEKYSNPVLLDWDGKMFKYYNCQGNLTNVIFIDSSKTVKYQIAGNGVPEQIRDAINQIDKAIEPQVEKK